VIILYYLGIIFIKIQKLLK